MPSEYVVDAHALIYVYLRLKGLGINQIRDCQVPELLDYDDELLIIVMTVVKRPFVLDFGGAHLERPADFLENPFWPRPAFFFLGTKHQIVKNQARPFSQKKKQFWSAKLLRATFPTML